MKYSTSSVEETRLLGAKFASKVKRGDIIILDGDLGCGKTEFVRGFVESFDASVIVRSPSFSIVNTYSVSDTPVYHFDFYRLEDASELIEIGFEEYCSSSGICLIEWGLMFPDVLPPCTIIIKFADDGEGRRIIDMPLEV